MFAKDIMNKCSVICTGEMPLMQVYQSMQENECEFITVVEDYAHKNPIGVVTEHEICFQIIGKNRNPRGMTAASVMNTAIIKAPETSTLSYCSDLFAGSESKRLFVVDENGALCGVLLPNDIEIHKADRRIESPNRSAFLSEYRNAGINRIF